MNHRGLLHHININVTNCARSRLFYAPVLTYFGYELFEADPNGNWEDWGRWELDTPHVISFLTGDLTAAFEREKRWAVGRFNHCAFAAQDRADVDRFYTEVLAPLEKAGHCVVEDPPCECPEHGPNYYATFFFDPDGIKYEFVINNFAAKKREHDRRSR